MADDCPMSEDCPAYDRERRMCLVGPGDCEFAPVDREAVVVFEMPEVPEVLIPDMSTGATEG